MRIIIKNKEDQPTGLYELQSVQVGNTIATVLVPSTDYEQAERTPWFFVKETRAKGSATSGNEGHKGRPGKVGGSMPKYGNESPEEKRARINARIREREAAKRANKKKADEAVESVLGKAPKKVAEPAKPKVEPVKWEHGWQYAEKQPDMLKPGVRVSYQYKSGVVKYGMVQEYDPVHQKVKVLWDNAQGKPGTNNVTTENLALFPKSLMLMVEYDASKPNTTMRAVTTEAYQAKVAERQASLLPKSPPDMTANAWIDAHPEVVKDLTSQQVDGLKDALDQAGLKARDIEHINGFTTKLDNIANYEEDPDGTWHLSSLGLQASHNNYGGHFDKNTGVAGFYDVETSKVHISPAYMTTRDKRMWVIPHEIGHSYTMREVFRNTPTGQNVRKTFDALKKDIEKADEEGSMHPHYGMGLRNYSMLNLDEFLADTFKTYHYSSYKERDALKRLFKKHGGNLDRDFHL